jgi:hypothetical protein
MSSQETSRKMRSFTLVAGLAVAALLPSLAVAQSSGASPADAQAVGSAATAEVASGGYADPQGRWVPNSTNGYYGDHGGWVITASGYYDGAGRWVAGQTTGAYDVAGRWTPGARTGHPDGNGIWVADAQPGYYAADHSWQAGPVNGYYDPQGGWITTEDTARGDASDARLETVGDASMPPNLNARKDSLGQGIREAGGDGTLSARGMRRELRELAAIEHQETNMRGSDGQLSRRDEVYLHARLDRLGASLRLALNDRRGGS